jgi:hypothetical protein
VPEPLGLGIIEPAGEPAGVYSPIDEIARASGFGMRQVELREGCAPTYSTTLSASTIRRGDTRPYVYRSPVDFEAVAQAG